VTRATDAAPLPPLPSARQLIAVGLAFLVLTVGLLAVLLYPQVPSGPNNTPLGPCGAAFNTPVPRGGPTNQSYLIGIVPSSGLRWGAMDFEVSASNGTIIRAGSDWAVWAFSNQSGTGAPLAIFEFSTGQWTQGGSLLVRSGQVLSLQLDSSTLTAQGDRLVAFGQLGCSGTQGSVAIDLP
jgi:hypothetical protein